MKTLTGSLLCVLPGYSQSLTGEVTLTRIPNENTERMEKIVSVVGGYRERDKLIRLVQYVSRFLSGTGQTNWGRRFDVIATQLGSCRTILRLFDDIPMLAYTLRYGTGSEESNTWLRILELMSNCANQLYFPLEHIAWCGDHKLIDRPSNRWWTACIVAWAVSLISEMLKAITRINLIKQCQRKLRKETELVAQNERESAEMSQTIKGQLRALKSQKLDSYLAFVENLADFVNAINWLPAGFLWSAKLSGRTSGLMGIISSLIKMIRLHGPKQKVS